MHFCHLRHLWCALRPSRISSKKFLCHEVDPVRIRFVCTQRARPRGVVDRISLFWLCFLLSLAYILPCIRTVCVILTSQILA